MSLDKRILRKGEVKTCIKCNKSKDLITNFRFHSFNNSFSKICSDCCNTIRRVEYISKPDACKIDNTPQTCNTCGVTSPINDGFYFHKIQGYRKKCIVCCNSKRKETWKNKRAGIKSTKTFREYDITDRARVVLRTTQKFDNSKNLQNDLSLEFIIKELENPCTYCTFEATGLDRKDNSLGHLESNCVACCHDCNFTRADRYTHEEMKILGTYISLIKKLRETP